MGLDMRLVGGSSLNAADPLVLNNASLATSIVGSLPNDMKISLKTKGGSDPSAGDKVTVNFRNVGDASYTHRSVTSALDVTVTDGSKVGLQNGELAYLYVYLIDNGGTVVMGVSANIYPDNSVQTTVAEGGAGAADAKDPIYTASALTDKVIRHIGILKVERNGSGFWQTPEDIQTVPFTTYRPLHCILRYTGGAWQFIDTASHTHQGVTTVSTSTSAAVVNFNFTALNVGFFQVTNDETYALAGIQVGASVGLSSATLNFSQVSKEVSGKVSYNGSTWDVGDGTNGLAFNAFSSGALTLDHDTVSETCISVTGDDSGYIPVVASSTTTQTVIKWIDPTTGNVVTVADTSMVAYFRRGVNGHGVKQLTSAQVGAIAGNFWISGLMEV